MTKRALKEVWKPIKGYGGHYLVSDIGNIRSTFRLIKTNNNNDRLIKGKFISQFSTPGGKLRVSLLFKGKQKSHYVHKLVATTFLTITKNYDVNKIGWKNEQVRDNRASNLFYLPLSVKKNKRRTIPCKFTYDVNKTLKRTKVFESCTEAALWLTNRGFINKFTDINTVKKYISKAAKYNLNAYGFKWSR